MIDFLNGDHMTQESTELGTKEAIGKDPEIASLLSDLALTPEQVDDYHLYPIADNDSPQLSADRLEYTLGNSLNYRILSHSQIENLYRDLCVGVNEYQQPEIMFRSKDCALQFAEAALQCSKIYISDPDRYAMQILAELLGTAIGNGILSPSDLNGTEAAVIQKLTASSLEAHWKQFRSLHKIRTANAPGSTGTWRKIAAKKRMIDPCIVHVGRCSSVFPDLHKALEDFKCSSQDVWRCGN